MKEKQKITVQLVVAERLIEARKFVHDGYGYDHVRWISKHKAEVSDYGSKRIMLIADYDTDISKWVFQESLFINRDSVPKAMCKFANKIVQSQYFECKSARRYRAKGANFTDYAGNRYNNRPYSKLKPGPKQKRRDSRHN